MRSLKRAGIAALCIAAAILVLGAYIRFSQASALKSWTRETQLPNVALISPGGGGAGQALVLPGTLQAFANAPIYAQITGNVQKWFADIGAPVKKGQLLAQIDPRPYQAALDQAKGALARDTATLNNAKIDLTRYQALAAQNAISNQQLSTQQAAAASDAGIVQTDQAAVEQASISLGYTRIVAPFDGIVTGRNIDIGNLVVAGTPTATPLFTVSDVHALRLYVDVPQSYSAQIVPGMAVTLTVPEHPGQVFAAHLVSSSGAISAQSSTMLVEFEADNRDGLLKPGGYAQVNLRLPGTAMLRLPASALMFRAAGLQVATLGPGSRIVMKSITIGTDLGTSVIVASGLSPQDRVVNNPPDSLSNGDRVRVTAGAS